MKKFIVGALMFLLAINVDAQWYHRQFGVNNINDLTKAQLTMALQKAKNNMGLGVTLTLIGTGVTIGGVAIFNKINSDDNFGEGLTHGFNGTMLTGLGLCTMAIGIPLWAVNANRKNSIKVALVKFDTSSFLQSNKPTYYGYKQPPAFGLSAKINF